MKNNIFIIPTIVMPLLYPLSAVAEEGSRIRWSGFATAGVSASSSETEYIERIDEDGDYRETKLGLNLGVSITPELGLAGQILMAGRERDFGAHADWVFLSYDIFDSTSIMAGRIKYPNLLFSEIYDVGYLYPWARVPQEIYSFESLGPNMAHEVFAGVSLLHSGELSEDFEYTIQPYGGNAPMEDGNIKKMVGIMISTNSENFLIKGGYNRGEMHLEEDHHREISEGAIRQIWSAGFQMDFNDVLANAEYVRSTIEDMSEFDTDSWYVNLGYRINQWTPYITYGVMEQESGLGQRSITADLRYDIGTSAALTIEYQNIDPQLRDSTVGEENKLPSGLFASEPSESTVNIVSVTLDVIF
ncbi:MAG: porin [Magnetococcales bacterium]|nr:porin [Magnetococcales bacterium]